MTDVTVKQFADDVGIPLDRLLVQLGEAGIEVTGADTRITDKQKIDLLSYLRKTHGRREALKVAEPRKITLKRKSHQEIKMPSGMGLVKTVSVEVRKKRTYVKRSVVEEQARQRAQAVAREEEAEQVAQATGEDASAAEALSQEAAAAPRQPEQLAQQEAELAARLQAEEQQRSAAEQTGEPVAEAVASDAAGEAPPQAAEQPAPAEPEPTVAAAAESAAETTPQPAPQARRQAPPAAPPPAAERAPAAAERAAAPRRPAEARQPAAAERQRKAPESAPAKPAPVKSAPEAAKGKPAKGKKKSSDADVRGKRAGDTGKRANKQQVLSEHTGVRGRKGKKGRGKLPQNQHVFTRPTQPIVHEVALPETITVAELAQKMSIKATEVIKALMKMGTMVTINQVLDQDTAAIVVEEMGHKYTLLKENALEDELTVEAGEQGEQVVRPPVVTIMGHVDHGKTSLLDYIRRTRVAAGEAGGITQHIGAYHVEIRRAPSPSWIRRVMPPSPPCGRAAPRPPTLSILVVAADDGVMPQTVEAIQHAKAAGVPLVVAVNKIDKADADLDRVKSELAKHDVIPEAWGGENLFAYVSAKTGAGVDELLEQVLVQAEVLELQAVVEGPGRGVVIESRLDKGRGPVASVLVQSGTLHKGDIILAGLEYGRVRAMLE